MNPPDTPALGTPSLAEIARSLRAGLSPPDHGFDQFLPRHLRGISWQYWSPLRVALRAAQWIEELGVRTVLDVGSGPGKFCVVAALASRALFIGLEQRDGLLAAARKLARLFEVEARVTFVHGTFGEVPVPSAGAYYLYNPFGENLFDREHCLDQNVELGYAHYHRQVAAAEALLRDAPLGTYLLSYNGFGGVVPASYEQVRVDYELPSLLRMWQKRRGPVVLPHR